MMVQPCMEKPRLPLSIPIVMPKYSSTIRIAGGFNTKLNQCISVSPAELMGNIIPIQKPIFYAHLHIKRVSD